jgi:hypothetical protein
MLPRFTENGFDVIDVPPRIHAALKAKVDEGVANWDNLREESEQKSKTTMPKSRHPTPQTHKHTLIGQVADSIYGPNLPKFVDLGPLKDEILNDPEMIGLHEQWWGGGELLGTSAYGVRLYQNGSSMVMHNDKPHT